jgi:hypothetical protein
MSIWGNWERTLKSISYKWTTLGWKLSGLLCCVSGEVRSDMAPGCDERHARLALSMEAGSRKIWALLCFFGGAREIIAVLERRTPAGLWQDKARLGGLEVKPVELSIQNTGSVSQQVDIQSLDPMQNSVRIFFGRREMRRRSAIVVFQVVVP